MKIESFNNVCIAYMRRNGSYGIENEKLMEDFKAYVKQQNLLQEDSVLFGIALDDPTNTPPHKQRYEVGILLKKNQTCSLPKHALEDGNYAVIEVAHTQEGVMEFWQNLQTYIKDFDVAVEKPILERYAMDLVKQHVCEFCIPLK